MTLKDSYPLPRMDGTLNMLAGSQLFSTLDLASGYWQVEIDKDAQQKMAFYTQSDLFKIKVMPFELCTVPATFQRLMDLVLAGLQWSHCVDDVIIMGRTFEEHLANVKAVLAQIKGAGLNLYSPINVPFYRGGTVSGTHYLSEWGSSSSRKGGEGCILANSTAIFGTSKLLPEIRH